MNLSGVRVPDSLKNIKRGATPPVPAEPKTEEATKAKTQAQTQAQRQQQHYTIISVPLNAQNHLAKPTKTKHKEERGP